MVFEFRRQHPHEKRLEVANQILTKFEDRIPVIVEKDAKCTLPPLNKKKYLVPGDITIGKFLFEIRKQLNIKADTAIFLFVGNGVLPPTSSMMSHIYNMYKDNDNFLYMMINTESTFGIL
jgi:GABA(A) receptor-associated protein